MVRRYVVGVVAVLLVGSVASAQAQDLKPEDLYLKVIPSVMTLTVERQDGSTVLGTAFLILRDGIAVTAWHVVADAKHVVAHFSTGEEFEVSGLIDKDERRDIALVRIKVFGRPMLAVTATDPLIGSPAYAVGTPRGLDFSMSGGLVSQIRITDGIKRWQFSAAASPGNSGGPLFNSGGEVIGVVDSQIEDGQNLNFAIPVAYVLGLDSTLPTSPWLTVVRSTRIAPAESKTASGLFIAIRRTDLHILYSSSQVFADVSDDVLITLKTLGVSIANPGSYPFASVVDALAFNDARVGASTLLLLTIDRPHNKWVKITAQYFERSGRELWRESKETGAHFDSDWHLTTKALTSAIVARLSLSAELAAVQVKANAGDAGAQFNLGVRFRDGQGVPQDYAQAVAWFRKAAEQGHADAQLNLGVRYFNGEGLPQDRVQAVAWWHKAAEQGHAKAQFTLGARYDYGVGVPQDDAQAVTWYRKAAEQGDAGAQFNLGVMYRDGRGAPKDTVSAYMWFDLSTARGTGQTVKTAATNRDVVAKKMTPAQLAEARNRVSEWRTVFETRQK